MFKFMIVLLALCLALVQVVTGYPVDADAQSERRIAQRGLSLAWGSLGAYSGGGGGGGGGGGYADQHYFPDPYDVNFQRTQFLG
jgi:hypothetical protein